MLSLEIDDQLLALDSHLVDPDEDEAEYRRMRSLPPLPPGDPLFPRRIPLPSLTSSSNNSNDMSMTTNSNNTLAGDMIGVIGSGNMSRVTDPLVVVRAGVPSTLDMRGRRQGDVISKVVIGGKKVAHETSTAMRHAYSTLLVASYRLFNDEYKTMKSSWHTAGGAKAMARRAQMTAAITGARGGHIPQQGPLVLDNNDMNGIDDSSAPRSGGGAPYTALNRLERVFASMHAQFGLTPTHYTMLLSAYAKHTPALPDRSLAVIKEMISNGHKGDIFVFNNVLQAFGRAGRVDEAQQFFLNHLKDRTPNDPRYPDAVTFTTLIDAWVCTASFLSIGESNVLFNGG
jgi:hypothetical protein